MASGSHALGRALPRPGTVDVALAVVLAVVSGIERAFAPHSGPLVADAVAILAPLGLAWRGVAPILSVALSAGGFALAVLLGLPDAETLVTALAPLLAVYSVGLLASPRGLVEGALAAIVPYTAAAASQHDLASVAFLGLMVCGALAVGRAVRVMGFETDVLEERTAELERERDERARQAVAEERTRIARELHDVIGHSISVMGLQAGAVRRLLTPEQEREREALLAVERVGRDAVAEMRRLLEFLREDEDHAKAGSLPTLHRLDDLVGDMRRAGLDVELYVDGDLDNLSPGLALVAFRILQEGLTNALKHAPGARVQASVTRSADELAIRVLDEGGGRASKSANGTGQGLVGMRERVALYGGALDAGPRGPGGFEVLARLPTGGP